MSELMRRAVRLVHESLGRRTDLFTDMSYEQIEDRLMKTDLRRLSAFHGDVSKYAAISPMEDGSYRIDGDELVMTFELEEPMEPADKQKLERELRSTRASFRIPKKGLIEFTMELMFEPDDD